MNEFSIPILKMRQAEAFIAAANQIVFGEQLSGGLQDKKLDAGHVRDTIAQAVSSAKPILKDAADAAKPFVPLAAAVVSTAFPAASGVSDAVAGVLSGGKQGPVEGKAVDANQKADSATASQGDSNAQLDMLVKLKDLLDGGIITQEEFDAKKRQILGL